MKKLLLALAVIAVAVIGLKKGSPATWDKIAFWKSKSPAATALPQGEPAPHGAIPTPTPAPTPVPATEPAATAKTTAPSAPAVVDKTAQVVVFCYHRVEDAGGGALAISPQLFEEHMQKLKDNGIKVISMQDFLAWRRNEKTIPAKSALITIDDGYESGFTTARPILKKFGYPWTAFVYIKYIGSGGKSLTWEQLEELRDEGVEIGSHTVSHQSLKDTHGKSPEAYDAWLRDEIINSKKTLESKLGIKCATFAYPEGKYSSRVLEVVKEAGYEAAFAVYGQRVTHGAPYDKIGRYAWYTPRPKDLDAAFAFTGPVSGGGEVDLSEPASASMVTLPEDGSTISDTKPRLKVNLATFGEVEPGSVILRLSGVGVVPAKFDADSKNLEGQPATALKAGEYTATVSAKAGGAKKETHWKFTVAPEKGR